MSRSPRVPKGPAKVTRPRAPVDAIIRCADCLHCQQFREVGAKGRYVLKVRCAMARWRRGKHDRLEATYSLHTLMARCVDACLDYESTSDDANQREAYLAGLAKDLPVELIVYAPDGRRVALAART